jgi:putative transcriptional regulator
MSEQDHDRHAAIDADAASLENQFLIAMPHLQDPYFNGSVTYVWKHGQEGALGIVVNQPGRVKLTELLEELDLEPVPSMAAKLAQMLVLDGGSVERNKGFILHESGREWDYTLPLNEEVSLSMSRDILASIAAGEGPERFLVALGCAGWEAGQLEREISDNVWLTVPMRSDLLFSTDFDNKASAAAALLGVKLSQLSSFSGHS